MAYKKYIVERVDEDYIYVVNDTKHYLCLKKNDLLIKENDQIIINDNNEVIEVLSYDEQLFQKIKNLENKIFK